MLSRATPAQEKIQMTTVIFHKVKYLEFQPYHTSWALLKDFMNVPQRSMHFRLPLDSLTFFMVSDINIMVLGKSPEEHTPR